MVSPYVEQIHYRSNFCSDHPGD